MASRFLKTISTAISISIGLTACVVPSVNGATELPQPLPTPEVATELASFYSQTIDWQLCPDPDALQDLQVYCGSFETPADWDSPQDGSLRLAAALVPAKASNPIGSIIFNPGGPGSAAVDWLVGSPDYVGTEELRTNFNIATIDPRGVGQSEPKIDCLTDQETDDYLYGQSNFAIGTPEERADSRKSLGFFAQSCLEHTGPNLEFVDTVSAAKDLDLFRSLIGDEKINYLGFSYGTMLGVTYADLYPQRVGRMVLDGAINPKRADSQQQLGQVTGFDQALRSYLADCLAGQDCPFSGTVDQAMSRIAKFLRGLETKPLPTDDGRQLTVWSAVTGLIMPLYGKDWWPSLSEAFFAAFEGNGSVLIGLADLYNDRESGKTPKYSSNILEANIAISCLDARSPADDEAMAKQNEAVLAASKVFGRYWLDGALTCEQWPFPLRAHQGDYRAEGAETILVVGTTRDPATPYQQAVELAKLISNARLLTFEGDGHTAYGRTSDCVDSHVDDFFIRDMVPTEDLTCQN